MQPFWTKLSKLGTNTSSYGVSCLIKSRNQSLTSEGTIEPSFLNVKIKRAANPKAVGANKNIRGNKQKYEDETIEQCEKINFTNSIKGCWVKRSEEDSARKRIRNLRYVSFEWEEAQENEETGRRHLWFKNRVSSEKWWIASRKGLCWFLVEKSW